MLLDVLIWILAAVASYISLVWLWVYFNENENLKDDYSEFNPVLVSVAIPAYNEQDAIETTVKSLLNSDYPKNKLEIIVVNDGSTDNTKTVLEKYTKKNLIKLINQPNKGKGAAVNNALKHAKGELFGVMDADTVVRRDTLRRMVSLFKPENLGAVVSAIKPTRAKNILEIFQRIEYLLSILARKLMERMEANFVTPGALSIYNKNTIKKLGGFDEHTLAEDLEMGLRLRAHGYDIKASAEADTYTIVPHTFMGFFNQRLRWNRGFLQNLWKYKYMLFNPEYKILGLYQLVINAIAIFIVIPAGFLIGAYGLYQFVYSSYLYFSAVGFVLPNISFLSLETLLLGFDFKVYYPFLVTVILALVLLILAHKITKESYKNIIPSIATIFVYYPILGFIWILTFLYEILRIRRKW